LIDLERTTVDEVVQGVPLEQLHHEKRLPVVLTDVVERANVWMIQGRRGARLTLKSIGGRLIARELGWEKLDRNRAAESNILRAVDDAHAAAAQRFENAIVSDGLSPDRTGQIDICQADHPFCDGMPASSGQARRSHKKRRDGRASGCEGRVQFPFNPRPVDGAPVTQADDLILRASSTSDIVDRLAADPWSTNGLLVTKQISPWQIRLGTLTCRQS
jgi:hypothetical protein